MMILFMSQEDKSVWLVGHLPFLDIPGGNQPASKLRMSVNPDWEASSVTFPDQHHGDDDDGDVGGDIKYQLCQLSRHQHQRLGQTDSLQGRISPVLRPVLIT